MKSGVSNRRWVPMSTEASRKTVRSPAFWLGSLIAMLWFFPDATLSVIGAVLHVIIGWIEIGLKSLLEGAFGLSHRTAQVVVAWGGMGALLVGLAIAGRRLWRFMADSLALFQSVAPLSIAVLQLGDFRTAARAMILAGTGFALAVYGLA